ncbi:hypothetical protein MmiAt1_12430 [Methanimicrococcus sp. At1]|uniref:DUF2178 domain-containing protein n=1 Tax=Methanimicrococcus hacksteinii TaxID=3028293 RepID=A0ABU3VQG7_9EURY|nr:hypothetical protein [Methanimicrococcus sp. At1]MDV0445651.1 hypothetical protein [Methanimicrococcus sp. At1]
MEKGLEMKFIIAGIAGLLLGILAGFAGKAAFLLIAAAILVYAVYKYYKIRKGEEIKPYQLIHQIQYTAFGGVACVIAYTVISHRFILGIFVCFTLVLLAAALIHAIRTDVLAMDN